MILIYRIWDIKDVACQYLSSDPIGLAGGIRPQSYAADAVNWVDPLGLAGCLGSEDKNVPSKSYEQARNKSLDWLEERGFKVERVNVGKLGDTKGKAVGMFSGDGKTGFRIEYDSRNKAHINVFSGKEKGPHFTFENATEKTVKKYKADLSVLLNHAVNHN